MSSVLVFFRAIYLNMQKNPQKNENLTKHLSAK